MLMLLRLLQSVSSQKGAVHIHGEPSTEDAHSLDSSMLQASDAQA